MVDTDARHLKLPIRDLIIFLRKEEQVRSEREENFDSVLFENAIAIIVQKIKETEVDNQL
jgi:hypothetical protein